MPKAPERKVISLTPIGDRPSRIEPIHNGLRFFYNGETGAGRKTSVVLPVGAHRNVDLGWQIGGLDPRDCVVYAPGNMLESGAWIYGLSVGVNKALQVHYGYLGMKPGRIEHNQCCAVLSFFSPVTFKKKDGEG